jgi:hypothetical protein
MKMTATVREMAAKRRSFVLEARSCSIACVSRLTVYEPFCQLSSSVRISLFINILY